MPINLFDSPLSSIKLGANSLLKAYIGNGQIFPNDAEITAAAFTNANIANTGGNTPYVVSGEIGASFTLTGSVGATAPSGTQVISASPSTYQIAIGDQSTTCGSSARNSQVLITPQGNTTLAGGLSNTDTIIQAIGPADVNVTGGHTIAVASVITRNTVTIGGQVNWSTGSKFSITWTTAASNSPTKQVVSEISSSGGTWSSPSSYYSVDAGGQSVTSDTAFQTSESGASAEWTYTGSYAPSFNFQVTKTSTVPCATGLNTQATGNQFP